VTSQPAETGGQPAGTVNILLGKPCLDAHIDTPIAACQGSHKGATFRASPLHQVAANWALHVVKTLIERFYIQPVLHTFCQGPAPPLLASPGGYIKCKTCPPERPNQLPHPPTEGSAHAENRLSLEICFDTVGTLNLIFGFRSIPLVVGRKVR
jgi:hypothetical protein